MILIPAAVMQNIYTGLPPLIRRSKMAIMAITSKIWINWPAEKTKKPKTQPIRSIIAIRYNITADLKDENNLGLSLINLQIRCQTGFGPVIRGQVPA